MNNQTKIGDFVRICVNKAPPGDRYAYLPAYATNGVYKVSALHADGTCEAKLCLPGGITRTFSSWIHAK